MLSGEIDRKGYGSITPGPDDGSARSFFVDHYSIASDGLRLRQKSKIGSSPPQLFRNHILALSGLPIPPLLLFSSLPCPPPSLMSMFVPGFVLSCSAWKVRTGAVREICGVSSWPTLIELLEKLVDRLNGGRQPLLELDAALSLSQKHQQIAKRRQLIDSNSAFHGNCV
ncbi:Uncharacterized protein Rs2_42125 [Raphanus sativus]|nr:Uncharacterized protein Rs2_42125 [Raphanus sativus]